jgi:hypothetical protein
MQSLVASASSLSLSQTSSDVQVGDRNPALLHTDIADCRLRTKYSVRHIITKLEQVVTHWNAILFQLVNALIFRDQSVYFCISNCSWNCKPSGVCERSFSPHWAASNYLRVYLFVRAHLCILFILDFKPSFSTRTETELKCNTGFRENLALSFYHIQIGGT